MKPPDTRLPLTRPRLVVRIAGGFVLTTCAMMAVLGATVWSERLQGEAFVVYWSWCFLLAVAAILLALTDLVLLGRAYRQSRRALFEQEFKTHKETTKK